MKQTFLLFLLVAIITSCDQSTSTKITTVDPVINRHTTAPAQATSISTSTLVNDPSFVDAKDTVSLHGPTSITRNVLEDRNGNIWFASWEGVIKYDGNNFTNFTLKNNLPRFHVFSILEDRNGNLWFGTIGGGVFHYDGKTFTHLTKEHGLIDNIVQSLLEDKEGNIWVGTANGVSRYDGKRFSNFTTDDGLIHNSVFAMAMDNAGTIWLGTQGGVSCFDATADAKGEVNKFVKKGDMPGNIRAMIKDKAGNILIGNGYGLWRYDGKTITTLSKNFTGNIFEDKSGQLWLSEGKLNKKGMFLVKYDGKVFTDILEKKNGTSTFFNQIFGVTEDKDGTILFGTGDGAWAYSPKEEAKSGHRTFTKFKEDVTML